MSERCDEYVQKYKGKIQEVVSEFETSYLKTGYSGQLIENKDQIIFNLLRDDLSDDYSLQGVWNYASGYKQGMLLFHPNGCFYGEYDVVKPHPSKRQWFVEAITVWGDKSSIKSEPKLIPAVE